MDRLARAHCPQCRTGDTEGEANLVDRRTRQRHDHEVQPAEFDSLVIAQNSGNRDRLDWDEVIPAIPVDDVRRAGAKVLERIAEQLRLALGHEDRDPELARGPRGPCAVVTEEVRARERDGRDWELGYVVDPGAGACVDDDRAARSRDRVDVAAVGPQVDAGNDPLPADHVAPSVSGRRCEPVTELAAGIRDPRRASLLRHQVPRHGYR